MVTPESPGEGLTLHPETVIGNYLQTAHCQIGLYSRKAMRI